MHQNRAAWIVASKAKPFRVDTAPMYKPGRGEVLIRNHAVAVNPVDWKIQDAAGIIEDVGEGVLEFHKGQRVIAHLHSPKSGKYEHAAYQLYSLAIEGLTAGIPACISFEQGVVLPLAVSTASAGLYLPDYLGLPLPSLNPESSDKTILIWGGASSVGATAIQLAIASGLQVIATASSSNSAFVSSLGAEPFDYKSPTVVPDILSRLQHGEVVGAFDAVSTDQSFAPLSIIIQLLKRNIPVASVHSYDKPTEWFRPKYISSYGIAFPPNEKIGKAVWRDYLPKALASGQFKPKPDLMVVGHGLDKIQHGLDIQKAGVSARKVVITL
ncbi:hypothetical protein IFM51744_09112 [Aspergillus udagawae]|uniref:Enoyl reductase (ER) domain-containing protein n=1 Tax=Aspergillus udagawae TaxID=91492 RepID=A0ABQ1BEL6_9EURO|nr:hypothetical protein IFM51744_09112 [Aspergillus udagawae]GFG00096.1 hypothetical protein IFM53868_10614 [Aspergillus udagawae]